MGRGGHLPKLRPLQYFALELDRELQQRLVIKDDAISRLKVLYAGLYQTFESLLSKCERVNTNASLVKKEYERIIIKNIGLRVKIGELEDKLRDSHTTPKKYLSPSAKKTRLLFLRTRQGKWLKKLREAKLICACVSSC